MSRVVAEVRRFLDAHAPDRAAVGVAAVSGGPDSMALLDLLLCTSRPNLVVAHFNHKLRGEASDRDEEFVRRQCIAANEMGAGLTFRSGWADVWGVATETGENLEAAGRRLRYDWLGGLAREVGAAWVATGHTADDQAETVLHRLVRGTGVRGLRGIAAAREAWPGVLLLRPLLTATKAELLAYLAEFHVSFVRDETNADLRFTRNRIRFELLPMLETFNPQMMSVLGRLAAQAEEVFAQLDADARALLAAAELPPAGGLRVFDAAALASAPPYRVRDALRLVWEREGWPMDGMTFAHWERLAGIVRGDPAADFPGGVSARRVGRVVQIGRRA